MSIALDRYICTLQCTQSSSGGGHDHLFDFPEVATMTWQCNRQPRAVGRPKVERLSIGTVELTLIQTYDIFLAQFLRIYTSLDWHTRISQVRDEKGPRTNYIGSLLLF
jgi:hypothetical protein